MSEGVIGLLGVVVVASISAALEHWRDWRSRGRSARYLASRVVPLLDRFVQGCVDVVKDDGTNMGQPGEDGYHAIQVDDPSYDVHRLDVDWKAISAGLMYRVLGFSNEIDAAKSSISGAFKYRADPPEYCEGFEERQFQYAKLAVAASRVADDLRCKYGVPARDSSVWDPVSYCKERHDQIVQLRARARPHNPVDPP